MTMKPRVIVGVGTSPAAVAAVRVAVAEARNRCATLCAVRARGIYGEPGMALVGGAAQESEQIARNVLVSACGGWPHDLDVVLSTPLADVGDALVRAADRPSDLLVVGSARHGALHRLTHGAIRQYVMRHARCAVLLVPAPAGGGDRVWWRPRGHHVPDHVPDWMLSDA